MGSKPVDITINRGRLKVTPYRRNALKKDTVVWSCNKGPFIIQFLTQTPFAAKTMISGGSPHKKSARVREKAKRGAYKYAVAVYANGRIYLDANCPAIIID
jgi:hypothetical protein